jgi:hypothetical protein
MRFFHWESFPRVGRARPLPFKSEHQELPGGPCSALGPSLVQKLSHHLVAGSPHRYDSKGHHAMPLYFGHWTIQTCQECLDVRAEGAELERKLETLSRQDPNIRARELLERCQTITRPT